MPATGLLALLDDIATMSKIAAQKTIGISGDDLAVNSRAIVGIDPKRELPIVYKVAKGSLRNKAILIPGALILSFAAPWAIMPLMMAGGAFLCYEGVEKIIHKDHGGEHPAEPTAKDMKLMEEKKVKSAIKTDLILSAEIVVVTLGAIAASPFLTQVAVLAAVGVAMTAGIYGLVGGIVKLDDIGLWMTKRKGDSPLRKFQRAAGNGIINGVPHMMKAISVLGTAAMFMVGGGLVMHGIPAAHHLLTEIATAASNIPAVQTAIGVAVETVAGLATGFAAIPIAKVIEKPFAFCAEMCQKGFRKIFKKKPAESNAEKGKAPEVTPVPVTEASPGALQSVPDVDAALSTAARKTVQDDRPPPPASPEASSTTKQQPPGGTP